MKLLVLSDSHGAVGPMERAVSALAPDYVLHLGDRARDARELEAWFPELPLISVPGNCDFPAPSEPLTLVREFGGVPVLLTHGHAYGVKQGLLRLELAAREAGVRVAVFGHTHRPFCEEHDGLWLLNPGSCGYGRDAYGLIWIEDGSVRCEAGELD